jgi:organic hydroperoxide reductase OsmC/OhrA
MNYRTPTVTSIGGRDGTVRSDDGLIDLQVGIPKEMGGPGGKTNPEELFAAGYAACFHSAVKGVAAEKKVPIGKSTVEAHVSLGPNDKGLVARSPRSCMWFCREPMPRPPRMLCAWRTRGAPIPTRLATTSR